LLVLGKMIRFLASGIKPAAFLFGSVSLSAVRKRNEQSNSAAKEDAQPKRSAAKEKRSQRRSAAKEEAQPKRSAAKTTLHSL
jgi:hypothetical protein